MRRPSKEIRVQMLEARLNQYEQQHESLEHDIIAATATGDDVADTVERLQLQQSHIEKAHAAICVKLEEEKGPVRRRK